MTQPTENVADWVREAANEVLHANVPPGFEWIEEYQQYYSHETHFYYEPNTQLFYDSTALTYYRFNEETYSYEVVECCQPTKWSSNGFRKRAIRTIGETEFKKFDQCSVDICELLFGLINRIVKEEHISNNDPIENKKKAVDQITAEDINKMLKRNLKRTWNNVEQAQEIFDEATGSFVCTSSKFDPTIQYENNEDDGKEVIDGDERAIMMKEENFDQPPCIRIIDKNQKLHIVTISGGYIGSDKDCEVVLINNLLPERCAEIVYNEDFGCYSITKIEKTCVVQVNSHFLQFNQTVDICHKDPIIISGEVLDVHVHMGSNTCPSCEPGLFQNPLENEDDQMPIKHVKKEIARRKQLKKMMRSYGITPDEHLNEPINANRSIKGPSIINIKRSNDVYDSCRARPIAESQRRFDLPPTISSSSKVEKVEKPIESENVGFKLLKAMGWSEGEGLGKDKQGKVVPVSNQVKNDKLGLGASTSEKKLKSYKEIVLDKTIKRFNENRENKK